MTPWAQKRARVVMPMLAPWQEPARPPGVVGVTVYVRVGWRADAKVGRVRVRSAPIPAVTPLRFNLRKRTYRSGERPYWPMRCASYPPGKLRGPSKMKPPIRIAVLHFLPRGRRQLNAASEAGQMAASDYAPRRFLKFSLARKGRPQVGSGHRQGSEGASFNGWERSATGRTQRRSHALQSHTATILPSSAISSDTSLMCASMSGPIWVRTTRLAPMRVRLALRLA